jgi:hypothetical protein
VGNCERPRAFLTPKGLSTARTTDRRPPLARLDLETILGLIDQKKHFPLHAPRQRRRARRCLLALAEHLNRQGTYRGGRRQHRDSAGSACETPRWVWPTRSGRIGHRREVAQQLGDTGAETLVQEVRRGTPATALVEAFLARYCERGTAAAGASAGRGGRAGGGAR